MARRHPASTKGASCFRSIRSHPPPPLEVPSLEALKRQLKRFVGEDIIGEYFSALEDRYGVTVNKPALAKLAGGSEEQ